MKPSLTMMTCVLLSLLCSSAIAASDEQNRARQQIRDTYYVDYNDTNELDKAFVNGNIDELSLFLKAGAKVPRIYLLNAIYHDNMDMIKLLVLKYPESVGGGYSGNITVDTDTKLGTGSSIDNLSTYCPPWNEVTAELLNRNWAPKGVPNTFCPNVWKEYISRNPKKVDRYIAIIGYVIDSCMGKTRTGDSSNDNEVRKNVSCPMRYHGTRGGYEDPFWTASNQDYILETVRLLKKANKEQCDNGDIKYCKAIKDFEENVEAELTKKKQSAVAENERSIQQEQYRKSPQSIYEDACKVQNQINIANKLIHQQDRIGEEAGVVDMNAIYRAGMLKTYSEDNLNELRRKYREKTGKDMDMSMCR